MSGIRRQAGRERERGREGEIQWDGRIIALNDLGICSEYNICVGLLHSFNPLQVLYHISWNSPHVV